MHISNPVVEDLEGERVVSANIKINKKVFRVFFSVPLEYKNFINTDASGFVALASLPAMRMGKNISVSGQVSALLKTGVEEMSRIVSKWPENFNAITVSAQRQQADVGLNNSFVGTVFSGGVDSFYTLLSNKNSQLPKITHLILVHGFDIPLHNIQSFKTALVHIKEVADAEGVKVIVVKTNARDFTDQYLGWEFAFGGGLAAVALLLRQGLNTVYVPSCYDHKTPLPSGSHPQIVKLWSTESLSLVHSGGEDTRVEKVYKQIAHSPLALKHLRVCWQNKPGQYNCGTCGKCIRTMIDLRIAGALLKTQTFNNQLTMDMVKNLDTRDSNSRVFLSQSLALLKILSTDAELAKALHYAMHERKYSLLSRIKYQVGVLDAKYNSSRGYRILQKF